MFLLRAGQASLSLSGSDAETLRGIEPPREQEVSLFIKLHLYSTSKLWSFASESYCGLLSSFREKKTCN